MRYCLIITSKSDTHTDYVVRKWVSEFSEIKIQPIRLNTEDFLNNVSVSINPFLGFVLHIKDSDKKFSLDDVYSVWFRRPEPIKTPNDCGEIVDFLKSESQSVLDGLYYLLFEKIWLNKPDNNRLSSNKILQLKMANYFGFNILPTIVSNSYLEVVSFFQENRQVCIKTLRQPYIDIGKERFALLTKVLKFEDLGSVKSDIEFMPTQYQKFIDKKYDARIIVIGKKVFAFAIYSQENNLSKVDFRGVQSGLRQEQIQIDEGLSDKILLFMNHFGLLYSAFDFVVDNDNKFYFIENNPNGQWLWLELETNTDISSSLIGFLSGIEC